MCDGYARRRTLERIAEELGAPCARARSRRHGPPSPTGAGQVAGGGRRPGSASLLDLAHGLRRGLVVEIAADLKLRDRRSYAFALMSMGAGLRLEEGRITEARSTEPLSGRTRTYLLSDLAHIDYDAGFATLTSISGFVGSHTRAAAAGPQPGVLRQLQAFGRLPPGAGVAGPAGQPVRPYADRRPCCSPCTSSTRR